MELRSTILLVTAAAIPVVTAVAQRPDAEIPTGHGTAAAWNAVAGDSPGRRTFVSLDISGDGHGIAAEAHGLVRVTSDGGRVWQVVSAPAGELTSAAAGARGVRIVGTGTGALYRSTDGGQSWALVRPSARTVNRVRFAPSGSVFAAGFQLLLRSDDGGLTWETAEVPVQDWYDIAFTRGNVALLVGGGGAIARSSDAGVNWNRVDTGVEGQFYAVAFPSRDVAVAVGGGGLILRSTDAGLSWQIRVSGVRQDLRALVFADSMHGVAVGMFGTLLVTRDGGWSWQAENARTGAHLLAAEVTADRHPIVAGSHATFIVRGEPLTVGLRD